MASTQKFQIEDIVYLRASANIGFLEAYRVDSVQQVVKNKWVYKLKFQAQSGASTATVGDAVTVSGPVLSELYFQEAELCTLCEASTLQIEALERRLAAARALYNSKCAG